MEILHSCGTKYIVSSGNNILNMKKGKCPKCEYGKITKSDLLKYINDFRKDFEFINIESNKNSDFLQWNSILILKHKKCNKIIKPTLKSFYKNHNGCNNCKHPSINDIKNRLLSTVGDEYKILSNEYKNSEEKIKFYHNTCKNEFLMSANNFFNGKQRCPLCQNPHGNKGHEKFLEEVAGKVGNEYSIITKYKNSRTNVIFKHNTCKNEFLMTPHSFLIKNERCPFCFKGNRITEKEFLISLGDLTGKFIIKSKYNGMKKKILVYCEKCKREFSVKAEYFKKEKRCKFCSISKGEKKICDILEKNSITFETQKTFQDCKDKKLLKYDFYIPKLKYLIEYDGEQHFKPSFDNENFELTVKHDKIKNEYAKENNIPLLRIKYTDFNNIEKILKENNII